MLLKEGSIRVKKNSESDRPFKYSCSLYLFL